MKAAVIVQARMGSSRLPGKMLMDIAGKTVVSHVLQRCLAIPDADVVCCAVPDTPENDLLAEAAGAVGVVVFRGHESDVLDRYLCAAKYLGAEIVLRITGDCPLIDPKICGAVLRLGKEGGIAYACNNMPGVWPHGLDCEAFPFEWLERAAKEATLPMEREHVSPFIRLHPEGRKAAIPGPETDLSDNRWTLDTTEDLEFLRALMPLLPEGPAGWDYRIPLSVINANPDFVEINRNAGAKNWSELPETTQ